MSGKHGSGGYKSPRIGEVYLIDFEGDGCEQKGLRPGVIFQNNMGNRYSPNIIALPMTSSIKKVHQPTHVLVKASEANLKYDSMILCENPQCISKSKLGRYLTTLPNHVMRRVAEGHLAATGALEFLDLQSLISAWQTAQAG